LLPQLVSVGSIRDETMIYLHRMPEKVSGGKKEPDSEKAPATGHGGKRKNCLGKKTPEQKNLTP